MHLKTTNLIFDVSSELQFLSSLPGNDKALALIMAYSFKSITGGLVDTGVYQLPNSLSGYYGFISGALEHKTINPIIKTLKNILNSPLYACVVVRKTDMTITISDDTKNLGAYGYASYVKNL